MCKKWATFSGVLARRVEFQYSALNTCGRCCGGGGVMEAHCLGLEGVLQSVGMGFHGSLSSLQLQWNKKAVSCVDVLRQKASVDPGGRC